MNLIIVSDIFGKTESIDQLIHRLSPFYSDISLIDPYAGEAICFQDEAAAYRHFQQHCGLEKLTELLRAKISGSQTAIDLIGFSVGATAVWELAAEEFPQQIRRAVAFYGSRIRKKTDLSPKVPTSLIFPAKEEQFELEPVIRLIENREHVEAIRTNYLHGFMNSESSNYSESGYDYFSDWLVNRAVYTNSATQNSS